ncbi:MULTISPECIES: NAD(P)/FAD-dependent oxidoreductase [Cyanophyceae]|uniref:phytoene desaturase family protein n=1 Tax=Cyanophyceae TaxID=3028117 RepID=UPI001685B4DB|nr:MULTISPECIES: NAD(P)/FAD-dependent oxidoreductase [Cyanophyceae]MBD1916839.1 NAD(P)/FAD-dependent oxidoreductase [Phormidium sp. FACHB-77]MBD2029470.1 NAD(P)/FAD-dependent oxidoreductase [Phormidium sp. FACHB-322]MBD2052046.1 NAD(P)/FAD-dependent oxidoreductase [Leptolyngbya sp. FACHB-60]
MAPTADIIIIGAGISGLAAGCYAQMNGYRSVIVEAHDQPGGLCTAWTRQGYTFGAGIHYIFGTGEGQPFYELWRELGAFEGIEFTNQAEFMQIHGSQGEVLRVHSQPDELQAHLLALAPEDAKLIEGFCKGVRTFKNFDLSMLQQKPKSLMTAADWARLGKQVLPFMGVLGKWSQLSLSDLAGQAKNPFLRSAMPHMFAWPDVPVMVGMSLLAYLDNGNAGSPVGGAIAFSRAIEQRYLELGGEIHYATPVERVLVEHDQAVGVRLTNGNEHRAARVISACDGRRTIFDLLKGEYVNRRVEKLYDGHLPLHSQFQVSLGVDMDFSHRPHWVTHLLEEPIAIANQPHAEIGVKHYCFDPSLAPAGKSIVSLMVTTHYSDWQGRDDAPLQAERLIDRMEEFYPGLRSAIEYMDVITPVSYEKLTGNWQGASCGWLLTKDTLPLMIKGVPKRLPGLDNFYMVSQWTEPGGSLPIVALSGRNMIFEICREDGRAFEASVPG